MAKQNINNTNSLIAGARFAAKGYTSSSGGDALMQAGAEAGEYQKQAEARKQQSDNVMGQFIESMPTNVDLDKVPQALRGETNKYLIDQRDFYFENAKIAAREGASSPLYAEAVSNMNGVVMGFNKLNQDFDKLKEMKQNYINDHDKGFISAGNTPENIEFMTSLTTDQIPFSISATGRLNYGEGATLDDAPRYSTKDHETAESLISLNKTLYSSGVPMDQGKEFVVRQQVRQALAKGGRDAVISMATDDYILPGGLGIQDTDLLTNPGRAKELAQFVEDQYVSMLGQTAQSGYDAIVAKERRSDNRAVSRSKAISDSKDNNASGEKPYSDMTASERRIIDAKDRSELGNKYMKDVMSGNTSSLIGGKYLGGNIINVASGSIKTGVNRLDDARQALADNDFEESIIEDFDMPVDHLLIITDKSYYIIDPNEEAINKSLNAIIISNKFGDDATTDQAVMNVEKSKPVLPVFNNNMGPQQATE